MAAAPPFNTHFPLPPARGLPPKLEYTRLNRFADGWRDEIETGASGAAGHGQPLATGVPAGWLPHTGGVAASAEYA
jgi:hypothetical protein